MPSAFGVRMHLLVFWYDPLSDPSQSLKSCYIRVLSLAQLVANLYIYCNLACFSIGAQRVKKVCITFRSCCDKKDKQG